MSPLLLALWLVLQAQPSNDIEPVHESNPVYVEAIRSGFHANGAAVKLPGPILQDGLDAGQQHEALLKLSGSERALEDLLRDSVTAPFLLKVRDQKTSDATLRIRRPLVHRPRRSGQPRPGRGGGASQRQGGRGREHAIREPAPDGR